MEEQWGCVQKSMGLGKSGRGPSTEVFKDLQLEPSMKPATATVSVQGGLSGHAGCS